MRLENLVRVIEAPNSVSSQDNTNRRFFGFEATTLVPYESKLIDFSKLDKNQVNLC
ncbi:hypothetical protein J6590_099295 [Homalodisca vitripennis]|nr:hypothetical protein J6590_099295 [Homalodisca vitripennis]